MLVLSGPLAASLNASLNASSACNVSALLELEHYGSSAAPLADAQIRLDTLKSYCADGGSCAITIDNQTCADQSINAIQCEFALPTYEYEILFDLVTLLFVRLSLPLELLSMNGLLSTLSIAGMELTCNTKLADSIEAVLEDGLDSSLTMHVSNLTVDLRIECVGGSRTRALQNASCCAAHTCGASDGARDDSTRSLAAGATPALTVVRKCSASTRLPTSRSRTSPSTSSSMST